MISLGIFLFLVGAVLAWSFRVWILVPVTLFAIIVSTIFELSAGTAVWSALGPVVLGGMLPQIGYCFGLFVRYVLVILRAPVATDPRSVSVAKLYRKRARYNAR